MSYYESHKKNMIMDIKKRYVIAKKIPIYWNKSVQNDYVDVVLVEDGKDFFYFHKF